MIFIKNVDRVIAFVANFVFFASLCSAAMAEDSENRIFTIKDEVREVSPPGIYVLPNSLPQSDSSSDRDVEKGDATLKVESESASDEDAIAREISADTEREEETVTGVDTEPSLLKKAEAKALNSIQSVESFVKSFTEKEVTPIEQGEEREVLEDKPFEMTVRLINKRLGRYEDLHLLPEQPVQVGDMVFLGRHCLQNYKGAQGADVVYLNALNISNGQSLFAGWLYALTPGVTGMSHPVYELKLLSCKSLSL